MHTTSRVLVYGFAFLGLSSFLARDARPQAAESGLRRELTAMQQRLASQSFATRDRLLPKIAAHLRAISGQFDRIDDQHLAASQELADWIAKNYRPDKPLAVLCVCTANSRRSILTATLGNVAAAYYGLPNLRFHCGGTQPSACNPRTVATLREIGIVIDGTGDEAPRGDPNVANPIYRFRWGKEGNSTGLESLEFSKRYDDPQNPQQDFAALMVCSDADGACPIIKGAALRLSLPFSDPKQFDNTDVESQKYAERRDDIGRVMLAAVMQARNRVTLAGAAKPRGVVGTENR